MQEDSQINDWRQTVAYIYKEKYKPNRIGCKVIFTIILMFSFFIFSLAFYSMVTLTDPIATQVKQETKTIESSTSQNQRSQQPNAIKQQISRPKQTQPINNQKTDVNTTVQNNQQKIQSTIKQKTGTVNQKQLSTISKSQDNTSIPIYRQVNNILDFAPILSGEIHFSRVPIEYWEHRLLMIKALGLNAVSVYIFWNYHELERGVFDFKNGERDLVDFLQLTMKHNLKVLLRPGPYVCAQWDFGGLPARLLGIEGLTIRASNNIYEEEVFLYFTALSQIIKPFLQINKGNIILIQIENEFGSYGTDHQHTMNLLEMWKRLGVQANFYYEDAYYNWQKHYWKGSSIGLSDCLKLQQYDQLQKTHSFDKRLIFEGEFYTGWLTHWGQKWNGKDTNTFKSQLDRLLSHNKSLSLFVIHGGTNFGLSAGANDFHNSKYMPHITSYDYDAPINQQGRPAQKYSVIRQLISKYGGKIKDIPEPIKSVAVPSINLTLHANLLLNLPQPTLISKLTFFQNQQIQMYHQGIVIYQTVLPKPAQYRLNLEVHDFALIYVDGQLQGSILRNKFREVKKITAKCLKENCILKILVEAMGHINYGPIQAQDRKGLISFQIENYDKPFNWKIYKISLNDTSVFEWKNKDKQMKGVTLLRGSFDLKQKGDTFFDLSQFGKGYIWVNNRLLGRYWNIGPQQHIFCPGVWLKETNNQIYILELVEVKTFQVKGVETLK